MLGYLAGSRVGAFVYNAVHTYALPAALTLYGVWSDKTLPLSIGLIWFAHIGADRALGYGLKYADGFSRTHLGALGRRDKLGDRLR